MITRKATIEDLDKVVSLFEIFKNEEAPSYGLDFNIPVALGTFKACIEKHIVIVLENNEDIVGGIAGLVIPSMMSKEVVFQEIFFYVHREYRNLSAKLLKNVEDICVKAGINKIVMASLGHNERLDSFYIKQDYNLLEKHYFKQLTEKK